MSNAGFGRGSGLIFLDNVDCDGTEPNLLQCRGNEPGNHNCGPSEDAGVFCPGEWGGVRNSELKVGERERERGEGRESKGGGERRRRKKLGSSKGLLKGRVSGGGEE